jgi:hypothetical protein
MRKFLFTSATVILFSSCVFNFNFEANTANDTKTSKLSDVSTLFVINPTSTDKETSEKWISWTATSSRELIEEDGPIAPIEKTFTERTLPYTYSASELIPNASRASTTTITKKHATGFRLGQTHNFSDEELMGGTRTGTCKFVGEYCYIWTLDDEPEATTMTEAEIEEFAATFDEIYVKQIALCGPKYDGYTPYTDVIGPNRKISVLLFDIQNDGKAGNLLGYFHPAYYVEDQSGVNAIELLCIDSYYGKHEEFASGLYSTLVHDFNHMLNFANKTLKYGQEMDTWYTEMLSMLTEDFFDDELDVDYLNSVRSRLELFAESGYVFGFKNWADISSSDWIVSFNYSNAYAFGAYLARNYGGAELFHEIATNEYTNEESVVEAVNKLNGTNYTFEDLLKDFCLILLNPTGKNGNLPTLYKSKRNVIDGYVFELPKINLAKLSTLTDAVITPVTPKSNASNYLGGYGFHYYEFEEQKDLKITYKDFLLCEYF